MAEKRIILVNGSRLMREMLDRILRKSDHLSIVHETSEHEQLTSAIVRSDADWVLISLPVEGDSPEWVHPIVQAHPSVGFVTVSMDGSRVRRFWMESREQDLPDLSLSELIHILENEPGRGSPEDGG